MIAEGRFLGVRMKSLTDQLAMYAAYHRERRNIRTHLLGIPMIVLAGAILFSRPGIDLGGLWLSPAFALVVIGCAYYLRLDRPLGVLMSGISAGLLQIGVLVAALDTTHWLLAGLGLFVLGWSIQFIGHAFEGRKPAFVDDVMGLVIGPLFVVAEIGFRCGWRPALQAAIEARVGPVR